MQAMRPSPVRPGPSPRQQSAARGLPAMPQVLTETEVEKLRGLGDRSDLDEVADVYLPLSQTDPRAMKWVKHSGIVGVSSHECA